MQTALTPAILLTHGFVELEEKDLLDRPIYRLSNIVSQYGNYEFNIEIVLNPQYKQSNPNCGIVCLHFEETTYSCIPEDLVSKEEWTDEDRTRVDNHFEVIPESRQPIAWHVTTYERLRDIVKSLTLKDLEYGK